MTVIRSLNLLVISTWFPFPPTNGSKLRAYHLLKGLADTHQLHLLTFAEPGESTPAALSELRSLCASVHVVAGNPAKAPSRLTLAGLMSDTPRAYVQGFSHEMQAVVEQYAARAQAVVALQVPSSVYIRKLRRPRLLEELEVTSILQQWERARGLAKWRLGLTVRKLSAFVTRLSQECDHVTVVSEPERQAVVRLGCDPARISVIPNGADPSDLERALVEKPQPTLIYPGAPTYGPNLDAARWFAREIWPKVRARRPEAGFQVTGGTGGVDLGDLPLVPGLTFTGFVPDVKSLIADSLACVVPLRFGGGTRLKVLEAMALGTPVVATTKAVEGLEVEHGVHVLIADTADHFAAEVLRLFDDPSLVTRLRAAGRDLVRARYTWPQLAVRLSDRLLEIAS
ncbi:MAG: glycosyltransferase family 4 protein [Vicinamibacterales bacterium]